MIVAGEEVAKHCASVKKVNPGGVDLVPKEVAEIRAGMVAYLHGDKRGHVRGGSRELVEAKRPVLPDKKGFYLFRRGGIYELRFPRVEIPDDCTGLALPRSSINRLGVMKFESAVFDSGYVGEPTQSIFTPLRAMIHKDEAFVQLVFFRNETPASSPYRGFYQNEKGRDRKS